MLILHLRLELEFNFVYTCTCTFGELAGTSNKTDLTLRKYMYDVLYINPASNSGSILMVLHYVVYISEEFQLYCIYMYILSLNRDVVRWYVTLN